MKKLLPFATVLFLLTGLVIASCTKSSSNNGVGSYTCHYSINSSGTITTVDLPFSSVTKATATSDCAAAQTTYTNAASGVIATCALK